MMHNDVIVVGAGMAGLGAARQLVDAGYDVLICEARSRIGGRVQSLVRPGAPVIELGAEFIHGDDVSTWPLVRQLTLDTHVDARWDGRLVWDGTALKRMSALVDTAPALHALHTIEDAIAAYDGAEISFATWLDTHGYTGIARHLADIRLAHSAATTPSRQSVHAMRSDLAASEHLGGNDHHILQGYSQIVYHLADGIPIWCDTAVIAIRDEGTVCRVSLADGRELTAHHVIVTVPLTVLKTERIQFYPPLRTEKTQAIATLDMQAGLKIVLQFAQPFWPADMSFLSLADPAPVWWSPRAGSPFLTGLFTGPRAEYMCTLPDPVATCVQHIATAFGLNALPPLHWSHIEDWSADPWIMGAYSSVPVGAHGMRVALAAAHGRVHFAGEATALDGQAASVHGALTSGWRAAHEVEEALQHDAHR